jgi:RNA polymerase subunit RPABC4/transcription elongation factor Spt4/uncharacterized membrane protein YeaQ/YmgE (transglycosylase-associated protein family)
MTLLASLFGVCLSGMVGVVAAALFFGNQIGFLLIVLLAIVGAVAPVVLMNRARRELDSADSHPPEDIETSAATAEPKGPDQPGTLSRSGGASLQQQSIAEAREDKCKACFRKIPADAKLCPYCGHAVGLFRKTRWALCGNCQRKIPADAAICPYCSEVGDSDFSAAILPVLDTRDRIRHRRTIRWIIACCLLMGIAYYLIENQQKKTISDFAVRFVNEQMMKRKITGYTVDRSIIMPMWSLVSSQFDIQIVAYRTSNRDNIKILIATINGSCLISECTISMSGLELLKLETP